jgi:hypothetical protein
MISLRIYSKLAIVALTYSYGSLISLSNTFLHKVALRLNSAPGNHAGICFTVKIILIDRIGILEKVVSQNGNMSTSQTPLPEKMPSVMMAKPSATRVRNLSSSE